MSKFFGAVGDSSSSDDDSSEESDAQEEVKEEVKGKQTKQDKVLISDEESSDPEDRKILGPQVKMRQALRKVTKDMNSHIDNKDFAGLHQDFNDLVKELTRNSEVIAEHGEPNFLLKLLMKSEDLINSVKGSDEKNMSKHHKKNFGTLKNKLKKFIKTDYEDKLAVYRKDPKDSEMEEDDAEDDDDEPKKAKKKTSKKPRSSDEESADDEDEEEESEDEDGEKEEKEEKKEKKVKKKKADSDDEIDWSGDSESSESDTDEEPEEAKPLSLEERRKRWLKKPDEPSKKDKKKEKEKDKPKDKEGDDGETKEKIIKETKLMKERYLGIDFSNDFIAEQHLKKMKKATTDSNTFEEMNEPILMKMYIQVKKEQLRVEILYSLITGMFSVIKGHVDYFMHRDKWNYVITFINELLDLVNNKVDINDRRMNKLNFYKFLESAHKELHTAFQRLQPQNVEYVKRLHDEHKLIHLAERVLQHYKNKQDDHNVAKTSLIILSHLYFKHDSVYRKMTKLVELKPENERSKFYILAPGESERKISELVQNVYNEGYSRTYPIQATLYQIYHHAIHNRFYKAREQMSTSQISKLINKQEEEVQILFNRTNVQIGLSAFRIGLVEECFELSKEIANYGKLKDLLAQSVKPNSTEKQMRKEKKRFVPAHLQIDWELVDFTHMVWAMLLEIPNISRNELHIESSVISRPFRKLIDSSDKNLFNGPPEHSRDFVVYASRALFHGDWRKAVEYLFGATKMWKLIPEFEEVKYTLTNKIKEVGFKVLMFRSSRFYDSFSIKDLENLFELSEAQIKALVSKMIIRERFNIKIHEKENIVEIHEQPESQMKTLASVLAEKTKIIIDHNIKIVNYIKEEKAGKHASQKPGATVKNSGDG